MAKQQKNEVSFEDVLARRCGLDINKKEIVATVSGTDIKKEKRIATFYRFVEEVAPLTEKSI